jgi:hypothetical protein
VRVAQKPDYFFQNRIHLIQHLVIPKTNHRITARLQETCSDLISRGLIRVLSAIKLYN